MAGSLVLLVLAVCGTWALAAAAAAEAAPTPPLEQAPAASLGQAFAQALIGDSEASRALWDVAVSRGAVTPGQTLTIDVTTVCDVLTGLNAQSQASACSLVKMFQEALLKSKNKCLDYNETGFGRQTQPVTVGADGSVLPQPLIPRVGNKPVPMQYNDTEKMEILKAEAGTYAWMWQIGLNMNNWYICSKEFGGKLDGYLAPTGWDLISVDGMWPNNPGIYALLEPDNITHPIMAMVKQPSTSHMIVVVRGTANANEWMMDFQYNRTKKSTFSGKKFPKNKFPGEVHWGFFTIFQQLWPSVQAALDAHVIGGEKLGNVTFGGHSLGSPVAALLGYASQVYLNSLKVPVSVGVVGTGVPNAGNSAFRLGLAKVLNTRRVVFVYDINRLIPCPSKSKTEAMPACTVDQSPVPTNFPASRKVWTDYQPIYGTIEITPDMMPAQQAEWEKTRFLKVDTTAGATTGASHVCSYQCIGGLYVRNPPDDKCLVAGVTGAPSEAGHTQCH